MDADVHAKLLAAAYVWFCMWAVRLDCELESNGSPALCMRWRVHLAIPSKPNDMVYVYMDESFEYQGLI